MITLSFCTSSFTSICFLAALSLLFSSLVKLSILLCCTFSLLKVVQEAISTANKYTDHFIFEISDFRFQPEIRQFISLSDITKLIGRDNVPIRKFFEPQLFP